MAGLAQRSAARIVITASTLLLAAMAWRVGWIDGAIIGPVLICILLMLATLLFYAAVISPALLVLVLACYLRKGIGRLWRSRRPAVVSPTQPGTLAP